MALVGFIAAFPVQLRTSGTQLLFFGAKVTESGPPRELVLTVIFVLVATVMTCVGEGVARTFKGFAPLGGLLGIDIGKLVLERVERSHCSGYLQTPVVLLQD